METEFPTNAQVNERLAADGWSLKSRLIRTANYEQPDSNHQWEVTLSRQGCPTEFTTDYRTVQGHTVWARTWIDHSGTGQKYCKGAPVPYVDRPPLGWNERVQKYAIPLTPVLGDVMYCLVSDASYVRDGQTLKEFGQDLEYTDLQKGVDAYEGCLKSWRGLASLGADFDALDALLQDY